MNDLHGLFLAWLDAGGSAALPRDVAVHASVCPVCQHRIAALDALRAIDPGRAALPPSRVADAAATGGMRAAGRFAAAAVGITVVGAILAVGAGRLVADRLAGPAPAGGVLGIEGSPAVTPTANPTAAATTRATATGSPSANARSTLAPAAPDPTVAPRPVTPRPTARPTPVQTPTPTPTAVRSPSPSTSAAPTDTPAASATPSAAPTDTPAPSP
jgi:hypothetical protein